MSDSHEPSRPSQAGVGVQIHDLKVSADYNQFYVWDAGMNPQAPIDYVDEDLVRMVKVEPYLVVVQPLRDMTVPVRIEICDADPGCDLDAWDHVVECSLDLPTGRLQVDECTGGPQLDVTVAPGTYRVRVLFGGLDTLSSRSVRGDDYYAVTLWPGDAQSLHVVKQSVITHMS